MNLEELMNIDLTGKDICVIGKPGAGKTTIARLLSKKWGIPLLSTDDFRSGDWENDLYTIMDELEARSGAIISEGVQMYRALRKGLELGTYKPHVIIEIEISTKKQREIYLKERDPKKLKYMQSFALGLTKVYNEYHSLLQQEENKPIFYTLNNEWL